MSLTLADARAATRRRLLAPAAGGLWPDADLDGHLRAALATISARAPLAITALLPLAEGAATGAVPATIRRLVTLTAPGATLVRPTTAEAIATGDTPADPLRWVQWDRDLLLSRPLTATEAGSYTLRGYGPHVMPSDPLDPFTIPAELDPALIANAAAAAVAARLLDSAARGERVNPSAARLEAALRAEARGILAAYLRVARAGRFATPEG